MKYIVLGSGARENIIVQKLSQIPENSIYCISNYLNPQIKELITEYYILTNLDLQNILIKITEIYYQEPKDKMIVIPAAEKFLEMGIVDELLKHGIPCIGPLQKMAMIETSKTFCRNYLEYNHLSKYQPRFLLFIITIVTIFPGYLKNSIIVSSSKQMVYVEGRELENTIKLIGKLL